MKTTILALLSATLCVLSVVSVDRLAGVLLGVSAVCFGGVALSRMGGTRARR